MLTKDEIIKHSAIGSGTVAVAMYILLDLFAEKIDPSGLLAAVGFVYIVIFTPCVFVISMAIGFSMRWLSKRTKIHRNLCYALIYAPAVLFVLYTFVDFISAP